VILILDFIGLGLPFSSSSITLGNTGPVATFPAGGEVVLLMTMLLSGLFPDGDSFSDVSFSTVVDVDVLAVKEGVFAAFVWTWTASSPVSTVSVTEIEVEVGVAVAVAVLGVTETVAAVVVIRLFHKPRSSCSDDDDNDGELPSLARKLTLDNKEYMRIVTNKVITKVGRNLLAAGMTVMIIVIVVVVVFISRDVECELGDFRFSVFFCEDFAVF
jgi:hypothetical protein